MEVENVGNRNSRISWLVTRVAVEYWLILLEQTARTVAALTSGSILRWKPAHPPGAPNHVAPLPATLVQPGAQPSGASVCHTTPSQAAPAPQPWSGACVKGFVEALLSVALCPRQEVKCARCLPWLHALYGLWMWTKLLSRSKWTDAAFILVGNDASVFWLCAIPNR